MKRTTIKNLSGIFAQKASMPVLEGSRKGRSALPGPAKPPEDAMEIRSILKQHFGGVLAIKRLFYFTTEAQLNTVLQTRNWLLSRLPVFLVQIHDAACVTGISELRSKHHLSLRKAPILQLCQAGAQIQH